VVVFPIYDSWKINAQRDLNYNNEPKCDIDFSAFYGCNHYSKEVHGLEEVR